jgi:hypothetical protein
VKRSSKTKWQDHMKKMAKERTLLSEKENKKFRVEARP